ncbi:peroxiredoxin-like family protein [Pelagicoccus mobilis]|uniref:AhpC/TSA family protein n=1 Tax=Pelagicoccus mobilis TaxID=415221 RepID=A0A934RWZ3_9BACT|nr:peroxiredoxin-like family protein [Pelagicoccus mobilis]MBK1875394.1 AhpC/TSA family protein [Pelagicoccus mobilis]
MKHFIALFALALSLTTLHARKAEEVTPVLIGSDTPQATLFDESGAEHSLPALLKDKHSIIVFYRGGWCPYCSLQMQELAERESEFLGLGYQIIGISPDAPEKIATIEKDGELNYAVYSDSGYSAMEGFGIDFHPKGKKDRKLPVPSVFIVTPNNQIAFSYVNPNYRERIPGDLLVAAAKSLKKD